MSTCELLFLSVCACMHDIAHWFMSCEKSAHLFSPQPNKRFVLLVKFDGISVDLWPAYQQEVISLMSSCDNSDGSCRQKLVLLTF